MNNAPVGTPLIPAVVVESPADATTAGTSFILAAASDPPAVTADPEATQSNRLLQLISTVMSHPPAQRRQVFLRYLARKSPLVPWFYQGLSEQQILQQFERSARYQSFKDRTVSSCAMIARGVAPEPLRPALQRALTVMLQRMGVIRTEANAQPVSELVRFHFWNNTAVHLNQMACMVLLTLYPEAQRPQAISDTRRRLWTEIDRWPNPDGPLSLCAPGILSNIEAAHDSWMAIVFSRDIASTYQGLALQVFEQHVLSFVNQHYRDMPQWTLAGNEVHIVNAWRNAIGNRWGIAPRQHDLFAARQYAEDPDTQIAMIRQIDPAMKPWSLLRQMALEGLDQVRSRLRDKVAEQVLDAVEHMRQDLPAGFDDMPLPALIDSEALSAALIARQTQQAQLERASFERLRRVQMHAGIVGTPSIAVVEGSDFLTQPVGQLVCHDPTLAIAHLLSRLVGAEPEMRSQLISRGSHVVRLDPQRHLFVYGDFAWVGRRITQDDDAEPTAASDWQLLQSCRAETLELSDLTPEWYANLNRPDQLAWAQTVALLIALRNTPADEHRAWCASEIAIWLGLRHFPSRSAGSTPSLFAVMTDGLLACQLHAPGQAVFERLVVRANLHHVPFQDGFSHVPVGNRSLAVEVIRDLLSRSSTLNRWPAHVLTSLLRGPCCRVLNDRTLWDHDGQDQDMINLLFEAFRLPCVALAEAMVAAGWMLSRGVYPRHEFDLVIAAINLKRLHSHCHRCRSLLTTVLLHPDLDVTARPHPYGSYLHFAVAVDDLDMLHALVDQRGLSVDTVDQFYTTPLQQAMQMGNGDVVRWCIDRGADFFRSTRDGQSLLHLAASSNNVELIRLCVDALQLDVNDRDDTGHTPLMVAAREDRAQHIPVLLANGADAHAVNLSGLSVRNIAQIMNNREVLAVLDQLADRGSANGSANDLTDQGGAPPANGV